jgi:hypothetical protein
LSAAKELRAVENSYTGRAMRRSLLKAEGAWNRPEPVVVRALQVSAKTPETYREKLAALEWKTVS